MSDLEAGTLAKCSHGLTSVQELPIALRGTDQHVAEGSEANVADMEAWGDWQAQVTGPQNENHIQLGARSFWEETGGLSRAIESLARSIFTVSSQLSTCTTLTVIIQDLFVMWLALVATLAGRQSDKPVSSLTGLHSRVAKKTWL